MRKTCQKNMFYNIKTLEKVWWEKKNGITLHSLSRMSDRSGGSDERAGNKISLAAMKVKRC